MVDEYSLEKNWNEYNDKLINLEQEIKNSKIPLVLYFSAKWCGPCKLMMPILKAKLEKHKDFRVIKIETDIYENLSDDYEITVLPSILIYHKGERVCKFTGTKDD